MTDAPVPVNDVPALPRRDPDGHKGTFGRVLVIGGSTGMIGAPYLAAMGALRGGAGLVTIAVPRPIQPAVASMCPCATTIPLPETLEGQIDPGPSSLWFARRGWIAQEPSSDHPTVVAIGTGLGTGPVEFARGLWDLIDSFRIVSSTPVVVDADALNLAVRMTPDNPTGWSQYRHPRTVITPHPGELSRLLGRTTRAIQSDRSNQAVRAADMLAAHAPQPDVRPVVVLKGAGTIVTDANRIYTNTTGNPGMATGGSGDVLTGVISALIAQGMPLFDAACLGVHVHGRAGDIAAESAGQVSLIATDLLNALPLALKSLEGNC